MFYTKGVPKKSRKNHRKIPLPESLSQSSFRLASIQVFSLQFCKNLKNTFSGEHLRGIRLSDVAKLKEKTNRAHTIYKWIENKAKHQLETILIIHNIQRRKNVNVICKDVVSWVARKQEFDQRNCIL